MNTLTRITRGLAEFVVGSVLAIGAMLLMALLYFAAISTFEYLFTGRWLAE